MYLKVIHFRVKMLSHIIKYTLSGELEIALSSAHIQHLLLRNLNKILPVFAMIEQSHFWCKPTYLYTLYLQITSTAFWVFTIKPTKPKIFRFPTYYVNRALDLLKCIYLSVEDNFRLNTMYGHWCILQWWILEVNPYSGEHLLKKEKMSFYVALTTWKTKEL